MVRLTLPASGMLPATGGLVAGCGDFGGKWVSLDSRRILGIGWGDNWDIWLVIW